ncbi:hypothetical protein CEXT_66111 [Caerostris extrusa]|uniref:Uncharacterized protein n=1 Tax=Caerostris extrusa TaxID=172846 RepID=A0AAV4TY16_CAEEX|nr:hypothetical protein CEXT_66111 [Caerostris extrusa]
MFIKYPSSLPVNNPPLQDFCRIGSRYRVLMEILWQLDDCGHIISAHLPNITLEQRCQFAVSHTHPHYSKFCEGHLNSRHGD